MSDVTSSMSCTFRPLYDFRRAESRRPARRSGVPVPKTEPMLHALCLVGIAAFTASGVLAAHRSRMDPFGGLVLAFAASVSGGTLRDLIRTVTRCTGPTTGCCWRSSVSSPSRPWRICTGGSCPSGR
ncbi:TRIC cation channel family protein [Streptomyces sp. NPDC002133]|uniref:trimeric intracellular cation channel family protein n=1 Tax=Streptomyces sp. NPDC002133 TaxID=3154409 RepID=UPI003327BACA